MGGGWRTSEEDKRRLYRGGSWWRRTREVAPRLLENKLSSAILAVTRTSRAPASDLAPPLPPSLPLSLWLSPSPRAIPERQCHNVCLSVAALLKLRISARSASAGSSATTASVTAAEMEAMAATGDGAGSALPSPGGGKVGGGPLPPVGAAVSAAAMTSCFMRCRAPSEASQSSRSLREGETMKDEGFGKISNGLP